MMNARGNGLRVLISGAAGGIGYACATAFAERGAELILCDHDGTALTRASDNCGAFSRYCDVVSEASVAVFTSEIANAFPSIDVLINVAGNGYVRSLGMMRLTLAMLPLLRNASGQRLVVNVAPVAGFTTGDCMFPYAGSREGFQRLSHGLADQTRGTSIAIHSLIPWMGKNSVSDAAQEDGQVYRLQRVRERGTAERIVSLVEARRPDCKPVRIERSRRA